MSMDTFKDDPIVTLNLPLYQVAEILAALLREKERSEVRKDTSQVEVLTALFDKIEAIYEPVIKAKMDKAMADGQREADLIAKSQKGIRG